MRRAPHSFNFLPADTLRMAAQASGSQKIAVVSWVEPTGLRVQGAEAFMGEGIKEGMTKQRRCLRNLQSGPLQSMAEYKAVRVQGKILRGWAEPDGY